MLAYSPAYSVILLPFLNVILFDVFADTSCGLIPMEVITTNTAIKIVANLFTVILLFSLITSVSPNISFYRFYL